MTKENKEICECGHLEIEHDRIIKGHEKDPWCDSLMVCPKHILLN